MSQYIWKHVLTSYFVKLALEACFSAPARDGSSVFAGASFLQFCSSFGPEYFEILWLHFIACYCMIQRFMLDILPLKCGNVWPKGLAAHLASPFMHTCILGAGIQKHRVSRARPALTASATPSMSPSQAIRETQDAPSQGSKMKPSIQTDLKRFDSDSTIRRDLGVDWSSCNSWHLQPGVFHWDWLVSDALRWSLSLPFIASKLERWNCPQLHSLCPVLPLSRSLASEMTASWSSWAILGPSNMTKVMYMKWCIWRCDRRCSTRQLETTCGFNLWFGEALSILSVQENLPPFQIVFLRFSAAALVLLPVLLFQGRSCLARLLDSSPLCQSIRDMQTCKDALFDYFDWMTHEQSWAIMNNHVTHDVTHVKIENLWLRCLQVCEARSEMWKECKECKESEECGKGSATTSVLRCWAATCATL